MHTLRLLHKSFKKGLPFIHQVRLNNVMDASLALIKGNKLTLTALGRNLSGTSQTRSNIKKIDRLLNNNHLHKESIEFYKFMNQRLVAANAQPWIQVDWCCICSKTMLYVLRATLCVSGRSIALYEECHPKKNENNHSTHKAFLTRLKEVLPAQVKPIIVTDAGFRTPWFAYICSMGWDFVGRLRHKNAICLDSDSQWQLSHYFYDKASGTPKYLGHGILTKKKRMPAHFVVYKGKQHNRDKPKSKQSQASKNERYARAHKEPWLLATSLVFEAKKIVHIYRQRMQIEENFRDTKSTRYGFGLTESRSRCPLRMQILLLIAAIATFVCWLAGIITREKGEAAAYQAQSAKFISLSTVYLGREALKRGLRIGIRQFNTALELLLKINTKTQLGVA